jgi:hypothetical protein
MALDLCRLAMGLTASQSLGGSNVSSTTIAKVPESSVLSAWRRRVIGWFGVLLHVVAYSPMGDGLWAGDRRRYLALMAAPYE